MHLSIQPKENAICVSMKSLKSLHTKETIYWTKGQSLLTSVDTTTNLPFYGMISRAKSYVFTVIFLAVFPLESLLLACAVYILHYVFQNRNRAAQIDSFIGKYCVEHSLWKQQENLFVWILIHCNLFVIRYIFWLKIAARYETLSIKTWCFHFSPA